MLFERGDLHPMPSVTMISHRGVWGELFARRTPCVMITHGFFSEPAGKNHPFRVTPSIVWKETLRLC